MPGRADPRPGLRDVEVHNVTSLDQGLLRSGADALATAARAADSITRSANRCAGESGAATDAEVRAKEIELILAAGANNPKAGYNQTPRFRSLP